ncbi:MAG: glycoside hydrolase family 97 protein [Muribaculaceae bacterium]|nr:glycoside hydrolase family 97 protein [Muribaculaceae bacterium]
MNRRFFKILGVWLAGAAGPAFSVTAAAGGPAPEGGAVASPDGLVRVSVGTAAGRPVYTVTFGGDTVVDGGALGIKALRGVLGENMAMEAGEVTATDETWRPVWGEYSEVRNRYNERAFTFREAGGGGRGMTVRFRVYDDGVGFRYELPAAAGMEHLAVTEELTSFRLKGDPTLYCMPGDYDTDEYLYTTAKLGELAEAFAADRQARMAPVAELSVQTPLMLKDAERGIYYNIHEAALAGYPAMQLAVDTAARSLRAILTPGADGMAAYVQTPFTTPWRALILGRTGADILASQLIYNLNEPSRIEDTSWIRPMKFMGVWWEMFTGANTWAYSEEGTAVPGVTDYGRLAPNGRHPANTANVKRYIDFASEHGIPGLLVEGWNQGWEDWQAYRKNRHFRFDLPYPDFDIDSLTAYARAKGVKLIMHHETAGNAADYERQLEQALDYMNEKGYEAVKTGYVGRIIPRGEHHSSQWMNDHYVHVAERAAAHRVMVDSHEAVRPTGLMRTWPNWLAQESARGGEYESMGGNTPEHTTILPFTRLKGGPMDYTPGLFEGDMNHYGQGKTCKAGTTLARQLALYLTMPSPIQMVCDLPENYMRFPDAFQFIKDVPVEWSDSRYLEAEPGDYITVARKDKNSEDWYAAAITDENARTAVIDCGFLEPGVRYTATIYADADNADWDKNPQAYRISRRTVTSKTKLRSRLAPGGGTAVRFVKQ